MRAWSLLPALILALAAFACAEPRQTSLQSHGGGLAPVRGSSRALPLPAGLPPRRVDFTTQIQPILTVRCQPCHFPGGKMYARMPFDRAETTLRLREKLFTRLKDEGERHTIRAFLAEHPAPSG